MIKMTYTAREEITGGTADKEAESDSDPAEPVVHPRRQRSVQQGNAFQPVHGAKRRSRPYPNDDTEPEDSPMHQRTGLPNISRAGHRRNSEVIPSSLPDRGLSGSVPKIDSEDEAHVSSHTYIEALNASKRQAEVEEQQRQRQREDEEAELERIIQESQSTAAARPNHKSRQDDESIDEQVAKESKAVAAAAKKRRQRQAQEQARRQEEEIAEAMQRSAADERARLQRQQDALREAERKFGTRSATHGENQIGHVSPPTSTTVPGQRRLRAQSTTTNTTIPVAIGLNPTRTQSQRSQRLSSIRPSRNFDDETCRSVPVTSPSNKELSGTLSHPRVKGKSREDPIKPPGYYDDYYEPTLEDLGVRTRWKKRRALHQALEASRANPEDQALQMAMAASLRDSPEAEKTLEEQAEDQPPPQYSRIGGKHGRKLDPLKWTTDNEGKVTWGCLKRIDKTVLKDMRKFAERIAKEREEAGGSMQKKADAKAQPSETRAQEAVVRAEEANGGGSEAGDVMTEMVRETGRTRAVTRQQSQVPQRFRDNFNILQVKKKKKKTSGPQKRDVGVNASSRRT